MSKDREKLYQSYHAILSMSLTWALALIINQYFELRVPVFLCAVLSLGPAILIYLFHINKKNIVSYLLAGGSLAVLAMIFWVNKQNPVDWFKDYLRWFWEYNGSELLYVAHHSYFTLFWISMIGALLFYLLMKKQTAKLILAAVIGAAMFVLSISKININKAAVGISIFYILSVVVELFGIIYNRKEGKREKKEGILYLAPICLLLAILSISLPSHQEPIKWTFVKNAYKSIKEQIEIWGTDLDYYFGGGASEFSIGQSGYSENGSNLGAGEGVQQNNKVALKLTGLEEGKTVYLIGSISNVYTGYSWEKSKLDSIKGESDYLLDYSELFYALSRQDIEMLENNRYVSRKLVRINYNNIKTKTFFYPIKTSNYEIYSDYKKTSDSKASITFGKGRGQGTSYQTIYYEMNLEGDAFQQMLRDADDFSYEHAPEINLEKADWLVNNMLNNNKYDTLSTRENLVDLLAERSEIINQQYTALPEELPNRVRELANELTADYDNSYDKLKAIEEYLLHYEYTLEPGKLPEGEDFTDYFLFENKRGYCTSFATAMAVLGRCIGVPTRYVEGFVATFDEKDDNGMYLVKHNKAHAWAEAYIEGVGWIPFEATSTYHENRYTEWVEFNRDNDFDYSDIYQTNIIPGTETGKPGENHGQSEEKNESNPWLEAAIILIIAAIVVGLLVISYYFILKYRYKKAFQRADDSRRMYLLFLRILLLLKREGYVLEPQETILMLAARIKDNNQFKGVIFMEVADIFMKYRYAESKVSTQELDRVTIFYQGLSDKRREEESRFKSWLQEYLFLAKKSNH